MIGVFLDTETNGLNPKVHRILDIAFVLVDLSKGKRLEEYQSLIAQPKEVWAKSDRESLKVNGFSWEEILEGKPEDKVSKEIIDIFTKANIRRKKAVFICQNPSFDRTYFSQLIDVDTQELLCWPYHWLDLASMYWAISLKKKELPWEFGLSKDLIATHYNLPKEEHPHRAINGVNHLILCYEAIVGYPLQTH